MWAPLVLLRWRTGASEIVKYVRICTHTTDNMLRLEKLLPKKTSFSSASFSVALSLLPRIRLIDWRTFDAQYSTQTDCRSSLVTDQQIETFRKDGVVHLKGVFGREWVEKVTKGIKENLKNPSEWGKFIESETGSGNYFVDYWNWQRIPEFKDFVFHSPAAQIASRLMDSKVSRGGGGVTGRGLAVIYITYLPLNKGQGKNVLGSHPDFWDRTRIYM